MNNEGRAVARLIASALQRRQRASEHTRERDAIVQGMRAALKRRARTLPEELALLELAYKALLNLPNRDEWHIVRDGRCDACGGPVSGKPYAVT